MRRGVVAWCEGRPALVLGALGLACLVVFLATIPLPRADGQLLGGDGVGYFAYLPSIVIDHDLDFTNQYAALLPPDHSLRTTRAPTGLPFNYWPIGAALLWLPFFLLAHALALALTAAGAGIRLDGCGYWHQSFVIAGNIVYGGAALFLAYDVARRAASAAASLWAVVLVACAGNLVYYLTAEPSMAHAVSAFAVSLFYAVWLRMRGRRGMARAGLLGALVGLVAVVRTQDVLLVVVPLAADLAGALRTGRERGATQSVGIACRDGAVLAVAAFAVYSPQFLVSAALYRTWWLPPQLRAGLGGLTLFAWWSPHLPDVLFSATHGLFAWHPVYALSLVGVVFLWRRDRTLAAAVLVGVTAEAFVAGSWYDWAQGRAFGGRTFIGCLPLFAMGLAALIDGVRQRLAARNPRWRWLSAGLGTALVAANLLLMVEFRFDLALRDGPATWNDLGPRRVTFLLDRLREL